jgi:hypothetical protein
MMTRRVRAAACVLPLLLSGAGALAAGKWHEEGTKKGVTVYTCARGDSPYLDVRGVGIVDAEPLEVFEFLKDPDNIDEVSDNVKQVEVLGSCGEGCTYIYERVGQPLVKDRHFVIERRVHDKGDGHYRITWRASEDEAPGGDGAIVVTRHDGSWTLSPWKGGTLAVYRNYMDVGGSIPAAFVNAGVIEAGYEVYFNLREHL